MLELHGAGLIFPSAHLFLTTVLEGDQIPPTFAEAGGEYQPPEPESEASPELEPRMSPLSLQASLSPTPASHPAAARGDLENILSLPCSLCSFSIGVRARWSSELHKALWNS